MTYGVEKKIVDENGRVSYSIDYRKPSDKPYYGETTAYNKNIAAMDKRYEEAKLSNDINTMKLMEIAKNATLAAMNKTAPTNGNMGITPTGATYKMGGYGNTPSGNLPSDSSYYFNPSQGLFYQADNLFAQQNPHEMKGYIPYNHKTGEVMFNGGGGSGGGSVTPTYASAPAPIQQTFQGGGVPSAPFAMAPKGNFSPEYEASLKIWQSDPQKLDEEIARTNAVIKKLGNNVTPEQTEHLKRLIAIKNGSTVPMGGGNTLYSGGTGGNMYGGDGFEAFLENYMKSANLESQMKYDPMLTAIQNRLNSAMTGLEDEQAFVNSQYRDKNKQIEQKSYEEMEAMKQQMARRGLWSSGIYNANEQLVNRDTKDRVDELDTWRSDMVNSIKRRIAALRNNTEAEISSVQSQMGAFKAKSIEDARRAYDSMLSAIAERQAKAEAEARKMDWEMYKYEQDRKDKFDYQANQLAFQEWQTKFIGEEKRAIAGIYDAIKKSYGSGAQADRIYSDQIKFYEDSASAIEKIMKNEDLGWDQKISAIKDYGTNIFSNDLYNAYLNPRTAKEVYNIMETAVNSIEEARSKAKSDADRLVNNPLGANFNYTPTSKVSVAPTAPASPTSQSTSKDTSAYLPPTAIKTREAYAKWLEKQKKIFSNTPIGQFMIGTPIK